MKQNKSMSKLLEEVYKDFAEYVTIIIEAYECGDILGTQPHIESMFSNADKLIPLTEEEFIKKVRTDNEFAVEWGVEISERDLKPRQRTVVAQRMDIILSEGIKSSKEWDRECDERNVPTKLTTITYNGKTEEIYE